MTVPRHVSAAVLTLGVIAALAVATAGCGPAATDRLGTEYRERFLLDDAPGTPQQVLELRQTLAEGDEAAPVVVVGTVGGMPNPDPRTYGDFPWKKGEATFFLVDSATAEEFAGHTHGDPNTECAFCASKAREKADAIAVVRLPDPQGNAEISDEKGDPLPLTAGDLLPLVEKEPVVVQGVARRVGELLVIDAEGLYLPR